MPYRPTTAPEILVGGERRPAARRPLSAAAAPRPPAPRAQDTRHGVKSGGNAFIGTERRFHWQGDMVKTHAMYDLPTQLKSHGAPVFGTSTREDWENTVRNKRDYINPNAGPANVDATGAIAATAARSPRIKFAKEPRKSMANVNNPTCPHAYSLGAAYKRGSEARKLAIGFNRDRRPDLTGKPLTEAMYYPRSAKVGTAKTIGARLEPREMRGGLLSPGPVYEVHKITNFKTGPAFTFGGGGDRFGIGSAFAAVGP